jgi:branched-chain amino acid transport system permease protein
MLGALVAAYVTTNTSMSLFFAVLAGALVSGTACVLTDLLVIGPIERRGSGEELPALVAVTAVLFLLQQLGGTFFGRAPLPGSDWVDGVPVRLGSTSIPRQVLVTAAVTFVIFTAVALWMRRTELGRLLRAIGDSPGAAQILGLPVKQVRILAFAAAGVIVAIAGCLFSATSGVQADNGFTWTLYGFFALVVGGRASIFGPLVGGVCLALVQTYAVFVFGGGALQYSTLVVGLLFFVLKPTGILTRQLRT